MINELIVFNHLVNQSWITRTRTQPKQELHDQQKIRNSFAEIFQDELVSGSGFEGDCADLEEVVDPDAPDGSDRNSEDLGFEPDPDFVLGDAQTSGSRISCG